MAPIQAQLVTLQRHGDVSSMLFQSCPGNACRTLGHRLPDSPCELGEMAGPGRLCMHGQVGAKGGEHFAGPRPTDQGCEQPRASSFELVDPERLLSAAPRMKHGRASGEQFTHPPCARQRIQQRQPVNQPGEEEGCRAVQVVPRRTELSTPYVLVRVRGVGESDVIIKLIDGLQRIHDRQRHQRIA